jgi:hypothetical protein
MGGVGRHLTEESLRLRLVGLFAFLQHIQDAIGLLSEGLEIGHHAIGGKRIRHCGQEPIAHLRTPRPHAWTGSPDHLPHDQTHSGRYDGEHRETFHFHQTKSLRFLFEDTRWLSCQPGPIWPGFGQVRTIDADSSHHA